MGKQKKQKRKRASAAPPLPPLAGQEAVNALLKHKQIPEQKGWIRDVPQLKSLIGKVTPEDLSFIEDAVEHALVQSRRVVRLPPNLGAKPEEIRISIPEAGRAFGIPERTIRDGLIQGLIGGHNFFGRTGWLTTVPEMRGYLRAVEKPGVLLALEAKVKELEAEIATLKKAAKKAA